MSEPLVTGEDLSNFECAECDHVEGFHGYLGCRFGVFDADAVACDCKRTERDVRLAQMESIVRREVEKALTEIRDALLADVGWVESGHNIVNILERRMGAEWANGGQR